MMRMTKTWTGFWLSAVCLAGPPCFGQGYLIRTLAGNGVAGYSNDNVAATSSELWSPHGIVVDPSGNIYIADTDNSRIRKITPSGIISTIAGDGTPNYAGDGGPAVKAELNFPRAITMDAAGNLYIADTVNAVVRKISTNGIITTIAGTGTFGYSGDGGPASSAQLYSPYDVKIDAAGNIYILDRTVHVVRKISPNGTISTFAGNGTGGYAGDGGPAAQAELNYPVSLALDLAGDLYIGDAGNSCIREVNTRGIISTVAGNTVLGYSGDGGPATSAQLDDIQGLAVDSAGNLYIADEDNYRIRVVSNGIITTVAGNGQHGFSGDGGPALQAEFNLPQGLAFGPGGGVLYVVDSGNNRVRALTQVGPPSIRTGGVISATAFGGFTAVAPGSWIEIYGSNLALDSRSWTGADFSGPSAPASLDGTVVTVGGAAAFIDYISPTQVNAQVPAGVSGAQPVVVTTPAGAGNSFSITVNPTEPGLLAPPQFSIGGVQYAVALFPDNATYVLPTGAIPGVASRPAVPGDTIILYGIGFGPVTPAIPPGQVVGQSNGLAATLSISIGSATALVSYAGLTAGAVGLYQFNVVVPSLTGSGAMPLSFSLGGTRGTQTLSIAVKGS